jgi:ectoine hydroxylase-related dioxygenase (phytanoyl-CoA dioxygenase family)
METVDRTRMARRLYPVLKQRVTARAMSLDDARRAVAACAEGYAFPTNLDRDPPLGGLAPESQQALMMRALSEAWSAERFEVVLCEQAEKRK